MFQVAGGGMVVISFQGDERGHDHAGQRCMNAGFQYAKPDEESHEHIRGQGHHLHPVEYRQADHPQSGQDQRQDAQITGVKNSDDHDGGDVIDDGDRGEKNFQCNGYA